MEMNDQKRRRTMIGYVLVAIVVYLVLSTLLFPNVGRQQITDTSYSSLLTSLEKKEVEQVEYDATTYEVLYTKKGEENQAYRACPTTRRSRSASRTPGRSSW